MYLLSFLISLFLTNNVLAMTSYADLVDEVMPSVVNISTQKEIIECQAREIEELKKEIAYLKDLLLSK